MSDVISINKKVIYTSAVLMIATIVIGIYSYNIGFSVKQNEEKSEELRAKFARLSIANTNSCGGTFNYVDSKSDEERIQGSCCGAMDFHRYTEQLEGLKKYSKYNIIPPDPYDVPVLTAKKLLAYQKNIILSAKEQAVYDEAMDLSHEGGPCCCKCWHWYAYEGLAKYLITEEGFTVKQIAEIWDLSDACGGTGHIEGIGGH